MTSDFEIKEMSVYDIPDILIHERTAFGSMAWSSKDFESAINSSYDYPFVVHKKRCSDAGSGTPSDPKEREAVPGPETEALACSAHGHNDTKENIAGYGVLRVLAPEAEIEDICVSEDMRQLGIGRSLLQHMISLAKEKEAETVFLEVRSQNTAARKLYEKTGFTESYIRKAYYRDPVDDAVIMMLKL